MSGLDGTFGVWAAISLTDSLLKGALILMVTAIAAWALRKQSAATRYALWMFGLLTVLVLPVSSFVLPQWTMPVFDAPLQLEAVGPHQVALRPDVESSRLAQDAHTIGKTTAQSAATASAPALHRPALTARPLLFGWIAVVWLGGAVVLLARLALYGIRSAAVTRSAARWDASAPAHAARELAAQLGIRRGVRVVYGDLRMPAVWGCVRPVIVLPRAALEWSWERCKVVLTHELAHVKRCDYVFHLLSEFTCALNWPNPVVWFAAQRARAERERSCDDIVLQRGTHSAVYASHLLEIARAASAGRSAVRGALAMARESDLKRRMRAILDTSSNRRPLARRDALRAGVAVMMLGFPISGGSMWSVHPELRVVRAIVASNPTDENAIRTLHQTARTHQDIETRIMAIRTLQALDHECDIVTSLVEAVKSPDRVVSERAARTLAALNDSRTVAPLAALSVTASNPHVRAAAVLGLTGDRRVRAVDAIHQALSDGEYEVRLRAVQALGQLGDERAATSLRCALWDRDHRIRLAALSALYVIDQRSET